VSFNKVLDDLSIVVRETARDCELYKKQCKELEYDCDTTIKELRYKINMKNFIQYEKIKKFEPVI